MEQVLASKIDQIKDNLPAFTHDGLNLANLQKEIDETCQTIQAQPLPRLYQLEVTSKCNLRCGFCPRTFDFRRSKNEQMSYGEFCMVLDKMPWIKSLELFHFGESLLNPQLPLMLRECRRRGIYSVLASNLAIAKPQMLFDALTEGIDYLVMDVDSLDPETYEKARVGARWEQMVEQVRMVLDWKPNRPYCVAQQIMLPGATPYTAGDVRVAMGASHTPDAVTHKFFDSFRGSVYDKGGMAGDDLCREAFYGFTVHVNGDVVPCDRDWAGDALMGNIFEQSVEEIWMGDKFKEFRTQMKSPIKPSICRKCPEGRLMNARSQPLIQVNLFQGKEVQA